MGKNSWSQASIRIWKITVKSEVEKNEWGDLKAINFKCSVKKSEFYSYGDGNLS